MSECTTACLGREPGHGHITITRPRFVRYLAYVRRAGERKYTLIKKSRSKRVAARALADAMLTREWKRGALLGDEGPYSYYEPMVLLEMSR